MVTVVHVVLVKYVKLNFLVCHEKQRTKIASCLNLKHEGQDGPLSLKCVPLKQSGQYFNKRGRGSPDITIISKPCIL